MPTSGSAIVANSKAAEAAIDNIEMPVASLSYRWPFRAAGAIAYYDNFPW